ncbi:MAG: transposase [Chthoniobacterales bacterium]
MNALASPRCATVDGFSLHANTAVHAEDRPRLERLASYCARPPIAMERLEALPDGRLLYRFKRPWRDGTTHIVMDPLELLEKLSALVPAPRAHLTRYAGVFAPAAKWRPLIVPQSPAESAAPQAAGAAAEVATSAPDTNDASAASSLDASLQSVPPRHARNYTWSELMKRVWALDVLECPRCQGQMKIVAAIRAPDAVRRILECVGLPWRAPPVAPPVSDRRLQVDSF